MQHQEYIANILNELRQKSLYRKLSTTPFDSVNFSSNDYLGLSKNQASIEAGVIAANSYGTGSTGSRLLSGNKKIFEDFENEIALAKNTESAIIFNSGYVANLTIISTFRDLNYLIIFDKLNHASMYKGISDYHHNFERFNHKNYEQLEKILQKYEDYPHKLIASETVFGMDGDVADISKLQELANKYNTILYLDEAHATGLYGKNGYGLSTNFQLNQSNTIIMGTFSKALASCGAYIALPKIIKEYLIQFSKEFIYSTAISPFCIGVARHNWAILPTLNSTRKEIIQKSDYLRKKLNISTDYFNQTNIIPIIFNSTEQMLSCHKKLLDCSIITSAIRKPTAPTPRLRIAINADISYSDIDKLLEQLQ